VGHGTAFDIAGKGIASEKSLIAAIEAAVKMAKNKEMGNLRDSPQGRVSRRTLENEPK
jgi:isocitrate/isopropylmalate dehydrogenase